MPAVGLELHVKMEVIISFLDLLAEAYNNEYRISIVSLSESLAFERLRLYSHETFALGA